MKYTLDMLNTEDNSVRVEVVTVAADELAENAANARMKELNDEAGSPGYLVVGIRRGEDD